MKEALISAASFLKWRLVPVRHVGRLRHINAGNIFVQYNPKTPQGRELEEKGYATGPVLEPTLLQELQDLYLPRIAEIEGRPKHAPFVNLVRAEDFTPENPLMRLAFSPEILDIALDFYGGHCRIDKLQVLYSFPVEDGEGLKESQKWHLDYNDSRSYHAITYLNDVLGDEDGPFGYINKADSRRVGRGPVIRRIEDSQLRKELGDGEVQVFYGKAGSTVLVDPSNCYHYGSRCKNARTAIFATFSSDKPYIKAQPIMRANRERLLSAAKSLRPDLEPQVLEKLMHI
ncbi:MAG: hypothetical protein AB8B85_01125 [Paracoccaceae bacterium]